MAFHFSQLFWGLLLVILDFSLNGFDLLVDGVGYLIVAAGCSGLSPLSTKFITAGMLCFVLTMLWLFGFAVHGALAVPYGLVTMVVGCAMMWHLLGGIGEFAMSRQRQDLADRASNRRVVYVAIMVGAALFELAMQGSHTAGPLAFILILGLVLGMLVQIVMILHLIHRVRDELAM
ncbi:hypothetical protein Mal64_12740 [Pseudobythopirellula maris]|uniref:Integral membrane protein n=1 Tax=Pseudobythopirellula maris TaxID=2527991 RepID=A0A5C5ZUI9_9BACT|nr:hypothetical protein [Pseudobythopirellula maris]TWT90876.1 hypothetical protein Mal64_12740 [Pseudobythopirellula maris]